MKLKYVMFRYGNTMLPVVFPSILLHKDVKAAFSAHFRYAGLAPEVLETPSAGFVSFTNGKVNVYGESESLKLSSNKEDEKYIV